MSSSERSPKVSWISFSHVGQATMRSTHLKHTWCPQCSTQPGGSRVRHPPQNIMWRRIKKLQNADERNLTWQKPKEIANPPITKEYKYQQRKIPPQKSKQITYANGQTHIFKYCWRCAMSTHTSNHKFQTTCTHPLPRQAVQARPNTAWQLHTRHRLAYLENGRQWKS